MRLGDLEYHAPTTLGDAVKLLTKLRPSVRVVAGGTDLLADLKLGKLRTGHLVSLGRIPELGRITREAGGVSVGALATANRIAASPEVRETLPALADAASVMGGNQIRNLATIGGNLASAVPSADLPPSLLVGHATVRLVRPDAERYLPVSGLLLGPRKTALLPGEILVSVHLPARPAGTGSAYVKFMLRDASALAVVGAAARITIANGRVSSAAVAIGAAAPTPRLVPAVADALLGREPTEAAIAEAASAAADAVDPISDLRGSAEYRRDLAGILAARALRAALARAKSEKAVTVTGVSEPGGK